MDIYRKLAYRSLFEVILIFCCRVVSLPCLHNFVLNIEIKWIFMRVYFWDFKIYVALRKRGHLGGVLNGNLMGAFGTWIAFELKLRIRRYWATQKNLKTSSFHQGIIHSKINRLLNSFISEKSLGNFFSIIANKFPSFKIASGTNRRLRTVTNG